MLGSGGISGFCMGGGFALFHAARGGVQVCVPDYGGTLAQAGALRAMIEAENIEIETEAARLVLVVRNRELDELAAGNHGEATSGQAGAGGRCPSPPSRSRSCAAPACWRDCRAADRGRCFRIADRDRTPARTCPAKLDPVDELTCLGEAGPRRATWASVEPARSPGLPERRRRSAPSGRKLGPTRLWEEGSSTCPLFPEQGQAPCRNFKSTELGVDCEPCLPCLLDVEARRPASVLAPPLMGGLSADHPRRGIARSAPCTWARVVRCACLARLLLPQIAALPRRRVERRDAIMAFVGRDLLRTGALGRCTRPLGLGGHLRQTWPGSCSSCSSS